MRVFTGKDRQEAGVLNFCWPPLEPQATLSPMHFGRINVRSGRWHLSFSYSKCLRAGPHRVHILQAGDQKLSSCIYDLRILRHGNFATVTKHSARSADVISFRVASRLTSNQALLLRSAIVVREARAGYACLQLC